MSRVPVLVVVLTAATALLAVGLWAALRPDDRGCTVTVTGTTCGPVLGLVTDPNDNGTRRRVEQDAAHRFPMAYHFHDLDDAVPTVDERTLVAAGSTLHVSIDSRIYGRSGHLVPWADVARGRYDDRLRRDARDLADLHVPVFVTFDHEPDQPQRAAWGSPADFVAAWRHVHDVFDDVGADNVLWTWVVTGSPSTLDTAGAMWPGNRYVDWIGWEAYNASGCRSGTPRTSLFKDFASTVRPFYDWLENRGRALGIDVDKPMMISEAASVLYDDDPALTAAWYARIPHALHAFPKIKAVTFWDHAGIPDTCRFRFDQEPKVLDAVVGAARSIGGV